MSKLIARFHVFTLAFLISLTSAEVARAALVNFEATIDAAQETTCAMTSTAQGAATATLNDATGAFNWNITFGNNSPSFNNGMLVIELADGGRIAIRPSGTEPKIKFYMFARHDPAPGGKATADELAKSKFHVHASLEALWAWIQADVASRLA